MTRKQRKERYRGITNARRWLSTARTLVEIRQYWSSACEDEAFGDPTYARAVKEVMRPVWEKTKGFHESEIIRVVQQGSAYYVCSTCGGNCGQCAMGDRFARAEMMFVAEFEHAAHRFLSCSRLRCYFLNYRQSFLLDDALEVVLQRHSPGLRLRKKSGFDFRLQCESNGHRVCLFAV